MALMSNEMNKCLDFVSTAAIVESNGSLGVPPVGVAVAAAVFNE